MNIQYKQLITYFPKGNNKWLIKLLFISLSIGFFKPTVVAQFTTINVEPGSAYFLGQGFQSSKNKAVGTGFLKSSDMLIVSTYNSSSSIDLSYSYDYTSSSHFQEFGASVDFTADMVSVYADYNNKSSQSSSYQKDQFTLSVLQIDSVKTLLSINNPQNVNNIISNISNFYDSYGDNLISSITYGRKLTATLSLSRSASSDFQSMQAGFGGSYNGFFVSGSADAYFNNSLSTVKSSADFSLSLSTVGQQNNDSLNALKSRLINNIVNICTNTSVIDKMGSIKNLFSQLNLTSSQGRSPLNYRVKPYSEFQINVQNNPFNSISASNIQSMIDSYRNLELCKSQLNQLNSYLNVPQDTVNKYYSLVVGQQNALVQKYEEYKASPTNAIFDPTQFFPSSQLTYFLNKWIKKFIKTHSTQVLGVNLASATCCDYQVTNFNFGSALGGLRNLQLGVDFSIHPNGQITWLVPYCYPMVVNSNALGTAIVNCPKYDFSTNGFINYAIGESLTISGISLPQTGNVSFEIYMNGVQALPWGSNISLGTTNLSWDYNVDTTIKPAPLRVPNITFNSATINGWYSLNAINQIQTNSLGAKTFTSSNSNILSISGVYLVPVSNGVVTVTLNLSNTSIYTATTVSATFTVTSASQQIPTVQVNSGYINTTTPINLTNYFLTNSDGNLTFKIFGSSNASISGSNLVPLQNGVVTVLGITSVTKKFSALTTPFVFQIIFGATEPVSTFLGATLTSKTPIDLKNYFQTNSNGITIFSTQSSCAGISGTILTPICSGTINVTATTGATSTFNGSVQSTQFIAKGVSAIGDNAIYDKDDIELYPNPSTGLFNLINNTNTNNKLIVTEMNGKPMMEHTILPGKNDIDISEWNNGIYYLQLNSKHYKVALVK